METKLLESVGSEIGTRLAAALFSAAAIFWGAGSLAWLWSRGWADGLEEVDGWLQDQSSAAVVAAAAGAVIVVTATGAIADRLTLPLLRFLEGYWPRWARPVLRPFTAHQRQRYARLAAEFQQLAQGIAQGTATPAQRRRYVAVDSALSRMPTDPSMILPSRFGNVLRAAEQRPYDKYRLDLVLAWARLWLVVPDAVREQLRASRSRMDGAALTAALVALSSVWAFLAWWMLPAGLIGGYAVYRFAAVPAAIAYGELIESTADLHRHDLYQALRLRPAESPAHDREIGEFVNGYLLRGDDRPDRIFVSPK